MKDILSELREICARQDSGGSSLASYVVSNWLMRISHNGQNNGINMGDHKNSKSQTSRFMYFDSLLYSVKIRRHLTDSTCHRFFPVSTILSYAFKWYITCNLDIPFPPSLLVVRRIFLHFMFSLSNSVRQIQSKTNEH